MSERKKLRLPVEVLYVIAMVLMAFGVACISRSDLGYSVITAPVYLIYLKCSAYISFGTAEYLFQGALLILTCLIVRQFQLGYLFTFVYAVLYGFLFDGTLWLVHLLPFGDSLWVRCLFFAFGTIVVSFGVALVLRTYLPPSAYELCVREVRDRYRLPQGRVKWVFDGASFVLALVLSLVCFGDIRGIGVGTILSLVCNAPLIAVAGRVVFHFVEPYVALPRLEAFFKGKQGGQST